MKFNKTLLLVSLAVNMVLALLIGIGASTDFLEKRNSRSGSIESVAAPGATVDDVSFESAVDGDSKEYYESLLRKDLSATERATLLVAYLTRKYEKQLSSSSVYWRERGTAAFSIAALEQVRADVLALVGSTAWSDSGFASVFQPFRREYPALEPQKQVKVHRLIQRYFQAHETVPSDPASYRKIVDASYQDLRKGIQEILTPSEVSEYLIRLSPLADATRRMRLEINEQQFRQLIMMIDDSENFTRLVLRLEGQRTSLRLYDPKLTQLLGKDQHLAFISRIDPVYGALASLAKSKAVPEDKLRTVYAAFVQQQGDSGQAVAEPAAQLARSTFGPGAAEFILKQFVQQATRT